MAHQKIIFLHINIFFISIGLISFTVQLTRNITNSIAIRDAVVVLFRSYGSKIGNNVISTRRLSSRPSAVLLFATGCASPKPTISKRSPIIFCPFR